MEAVGGGASRKPLTVIISSILNRMEYINEAIRRLVSGVCFTEYSYMTKLLETILKKKKKFYIARTFGIFSHRPSTFLPRRWVTYSSFLPLVVVAVVWDSSSHSRIFLLLAARLKRSTCMIYEWKVLSDDVCDV